MRWKTVLFVLVFSGVMYGLVGAPGVAVLDIHRRAEIVAAQPEINALQATLRAHPDAPQGWARLGQRWMETGEYTRSAEAYRHAVLLTEGDPGMILQMCKALIFAADGEVTAKAAEGLEMVRTLDPGNQEARYFLALQELQHGNAAAAMHSMKSLYAELPEDSPLKALMNRQIGRR